jgi:putative nucleotidyltransferase with HDIG domain
VLAVSVAGLAFQELGGPGAGRWLPGPGQLAPMLGAAGAYLAVRNGLRLLAGTILEGRALKDLWQARVRREMLHELLLLPFAVLLAVTQIRQGRIGLSFLFLSLLVARYVYRNWRDTRRAHLATVRALMAAVDAADPFSRGHAERVSRLALAMARHLGVPRRDHEEIEYGALLHDIGRTAIENEVLLKPGRLSSGERALMQTHPRIGYEILKGLQLIEGAADLVHAHHEQPDGRGYPRGLAGEQIPVGARIIMVAAAFDAMTADRPYRRGLSAEAACEELRRHSGTQFFPEMVEALIELHAAGRLPDFAAPGTLLDSCRPSDRPLSESFLAGPGAGLPVVEATAIEVPGDLAARMEGEERRAG